MENGGTQWRKIEKSGRRIENNFNVGNWNGIGGLKMRMTWIIVYGHENI